MSNDEIARRVARSFHVSANNWEGCDWTTTFGPRNLDLCGLRARQTRLLADATSGEEAAAWTAATLWLEQVEQRARDARLAASAAVDMFQQQQWSVALAYADAACTLESQYHTQLVWGPLRDLIALAVRRRDKETES